MYTDRNFKTKAALKRAVAAGEDITYHCPSGRGAPRDGFIYIEGPHFPEPRRWYAKCEVKDNRIVRVCK